MAQDPPDAATLLDAVADWMREQLLPELKGRQAFMARVAINLLGIVGRELREGGAKQAAEHQRLVALLGSQGSLDTLNRQLCEGIRDGSLDPRRDEVLKHVRATVREKLDIANPRHR